MAGWWALPLCVWYIAVISGSHTDLQITNAAGKLVYTVLYHQAVRGITCETHLSQILISYECCNVSALLKAVPGCNFEHSALQTCASILAPKWSSLAAVGICTVGFETQTAA